MEQNKNIENQFREKLNQRTVEPSDKAWDRLDAMLSVTEKKKTKRNWLWIAAGLILFVTIGSLFVRTNKNELIPAKDVVVNENHHPENLPVLTPETKDEEILAVNEEVSEKEFNRKIILTDSFQVVQKKDVFYNNTYDDFRNETSEIDIVEVDIESESDNNYQPNTYVTAQDLLGSVKNEKQFAEQTSKPTVTIDHRSLLYQAEMEVEQQYRKNAIDRFLQKSYDNMRVAALNKF